MEDQFEEFLSLNCSYKKAHHISYSHNICDKDEVWYVSHKDLHEEKTRLGYDCDNCFEEVHTTTEGSNVKRMPVCFLCGESGHHGEKCPTESCENCFSVDHTTVKCQMGKSIEFPENCTLCNYAGHSEDNCPDYWRRFHLKKDYNIICNGNGTINRDVFCYNCGNDGHFGYQCSEPRMNEKTFPTTPFIINYVSPYKMKFFRNADKLLKLFRKEKRKAKLIEKKDRELKLIQMGIELESKSKRKKKKKDWVLVESNSDREERKSRYKGSFRPIRRRYFNRKESTHS